MVKKQLHGENTHTQVGLLCSPGSGRLLSVCLAPHESLTKNKNLHLGLEMNKVPQQTDGPEA